MTDLSSIAAEARRMARYQLRMACAFEPDSVGERTARQAAADFDRLAEMADDAMADTTFSRALAERLAEP